jgi:hypothetical protein
MTHIGTSAGATSGPSNVLVSAVTRTDQMNRRNFYDDSCMDSVLCLQSLSRTSGAIHSESARAATINQQIRIALSGSFILSASD